MNQHPDCTPNDLLHMIDAPTARRLEDLSVDELAALCGLKRDEDKDWIGKLPWQENACVMVSARSNLLWFAYGVGGCQIVDQPVTEHAALLALAKHLKVQPTTPPTPAPIVEPAPVQRGGNVALVMRAYEAWRRDPEITADVDDATARAFGEMLAEAYVADAKEGA